MFGAKKKIGGLPKKKNKLYGAAAAAVKRRQLTDKLLRGGNLSLSQLTTLADAKSAGGGARVLAGTVLCLVTPSATSGRLLCSAHSAIAVKRAKKEYNLDDEDLEGAHRA